MRILVSVREPAYEAYRGSLALALLLSVSGPLAAGAEVPSMENRSVLTIWLYDYAQLDSNVLSKARQVTSAILARAGIAIRWGQCYGQELEDYQDFPCSQQADASVLQLRIQLTRRAKVFNRSALQYGYALPSRSGFGVIAGVFANRIRTLAREEGRQVHILLAHVMAHEVGHLLLGSNNHARQGIMLAEWKSRQLQRAEMGRLGFTPEQEHLLRRQVRARLLARHQGPHLSVRAERSNVPAFLKPLQSSYSLRGGTSFGEMLSFFRRADRDQAPPLGGGCSWPSEIPPKPATN